MFCHRILRNVAAISAAAAFLCAPAWGKTIKLIVVAASPPQVTPVAVTKNYFIPEVNKRLAAAGGKHEIQWTEAYGQTLATFTEVLEAVEEGIAHVGVQLRLFETSKLPLEQYAMVAPFGETDMYRMLNIDAKVREKVPEMNKTYEKYNQIYIAGSVSESMHLITRFPVRTVDDLKGHKIGASGSLGQYLRGTGGVIVTANMAQSALDIKNGVYDGYTIGTVLAFAYKTYESAKYFTRTNFGVTPVPALTVNTDAWKGLPEEVRTVFLDVAKDWGVKNADADAAKIAKFTGIMAKAGVKFTDMPEAERKRWAMMMPNIAREWADRMDKRGLPGTKILTAYQDELRARKVQIPRQWDR